MFGCCAVRWWRSWRTQTDHCAFNILFSKNVPHILEKIFFNLDYESFKNCLLVNKTWSQLLTTERYQKMAKSSFHYEISRDNERLFYASERGNANEVRRLLTFGLVDVNCVQGLGQSTPLIEAVRCDYSSCTESYKKIVRMLLARGADPNKASKYGATPLYEAVIKGPHMDVIQLLVDAGADPSLAELPNPITEPHVKN